LALLDEVSWVQEMQLLGYRSQLPRHTHSMLLIFEHWGRSALWVHLLQGHGEYQHRQPKQEKRKQVQQQQEQERQPHIRHPQDQPQLQAFQLRIQGLRVRPILSKCPRASQALGSLLLLHGHLVPLAR